MGYTVRWTAKDVSADDCFDAAVEAWDMLRDPDATPPLFEIETPNNELVEIDLLHVTAVSREVEPEADVEEGTMPT